MKIAVIGATGQLGTDLMKTFNQKHEGAGYTHQDLEVTDYKSCLIIKKAKPDVIINTAAFHKLTLCEEDPPKAFSVNALGARNIATVSREIGATAVYISTDYVFDGLTNEPYTEEDAPNPLNTYGISKLAGELYTKQSPKHYVVRLASLFGVAGASGKGGNFVETMLNKAKKNEKITVVNDMWMSPTYTKDAATTIKQIIEAQLPFGVYHAANRGYCTWYQFAEEIFRQLDRDPTLTPITTDQLQMKVKRPPFSALKTAKLSKYSIERREWRKALHDYLIEKGHM